MSEASHVYILSGQKFIKNAQNGQPEACGHTVIPDKSILKRQKVTENAKIHKLINDIFWNFQRMWNETFRGHFKHCEKYVPWMCKKVGILL